jgi:ParB family transcriptional regulator, chromosome partitioning protein
MEKRRLGRGLDALLGSSTDGAASRSEQASIAIEQIEQNPFQPRKVFDEEELTALRESIRTHGLLQPLVVRPIADHYQLVAGERRLRAAAAAGLTEVPVHIVDFNDQQILEAALVENIHRSDLNPIEKAQGFKDYLKRFSMTQEQLATRLGLDRTTISNLINLLDLPLEVQEAVRRQQISLGHAKVLKGLANSDRQVVVCREIIGRGLSVRATEALLKDQPAEEPESRPKKEPLEKTSHVQALETELQKTLAIPVEIRLRGKDRGQIVLSFESNDDFERLLDILRGGKPDQDPS